MLFNDLKSYWLLQSVHGICLFIIDSLAVLEWSNIAAVVSLVLALLSKILKIIAGRHPKMEWLLERLISIGTNLLLLQRVAVMVMGVVCKNNKKTDYGRDHHE